MVKVEIRAAQTQDPTRLERRLEATADGITAIDLLADGVPLSRQKLKKSMEKGAVWLKKAKGGRRRLRRARTALLEGDVLELYYDARILASVPPVPGLIADMRAYSVWLKPENMLSQGSRFADHCAITRWVEKHHQPRRAVYPVHRLDRAASGLILLAHNQPTAAGLSALFRERKIRKRYRVVVNARVSEPLPLRITTPLDSKAAETVILSARTMGAQSELMVEIETGRKHQIRRHLSEHGWPVQGDRLYGDRQAQGSLMLSAEYLGFDCPVTGRPVSFETDSRTGTD